MESNSFQFDWEKAFGSSPPVGFILGEVPKKFWVRFHALPKSKRYAETKEETAVILHRANCLASEMFSENSEIWLSVMGRGGDSFPREYYAEAKQIPLVSNRDINGEIGNPEEACFVNFHAEKVRWQSGKLDEIFELIADDQERGFLFAPDTRFVFAPYDGGFDMFWTSATQVAQVKAKYKSWLSSHPEGL